jgi:hypothetical protein
MLVGKGLQELRGKIWIYILQFRHIEILPWWFYYFFFSLLINFPKLNALAVTGKHFHIFSLIFQPMYTSNFLFHIHTSQRVKLLGMWLKFCEVFVLQVFFLIILKGLEYDDSSSFISETKKLTCCIKFYYWNYILLHDFFVGAFVSKKLCEFVIATFA